MNLDAIILAGGMGTRLRELVKDVPKPLAKVGDRPFLDILLKQLAQSSQVSKVILAIGYKAKAIEDAYKSHEFPFEIECVVEPKPLGTGGAIKNALSHTKSDPVLILNGDSYVDFNLADLMAVHVRNESPFSMVLTQVPDTSRYGRVEFDEDSFCINNFSEKKAGMGKGWINAGVSLIRKNLLENYENEVFSFEKEVLPSLINSKIHACLAQGKFIDIGTPESYEYAQDYLKGLV
jgi:D-glycero-alpha-D-manno-heptose 1-phosphate guanylyltransferase